MFFKGKRKSEDVSEVKTVKGGIQTGSLFTLFGKLDASPLHDTAPIPWLLEGLPSVCFINLLELKISQDMRQNSSCIVYTLAKD